MRPRPRLPFLPARSAEPSHASDPQTGTQRDARLAARADASAQAAARYAAASQSAARTVIKRYSSSFSLASSTLPRAVRTHIEAIYAMVRVADETVDGAWTGATPAQVRAELDAFESRIARAVETGFSSDLLAHAFARTARATGISSTQWGPFFDSMRADAVPAPDPASPAHSRRDLSAYIHGSAEVVGEMCVLAFFNGAPLPADAQTTLLPGARALGSAFQKVNFLRDLAHDSHGLARGYLSSPGRAATDFTEEDKEALTAEIFAELSTAAEAVDLLPPPVRPAVWTAFGIFGDLTHQLAGTSVETILSGRVRVPGAVKLRYAALAAAGRPVRTWPGMPARYTSERPGTQP